MKIPCEQYIGRCKSGGMLYEAVKRLEQIKNRESIMTAKILPLNTYDVYEFPWGSAVKDWRRDKWLTIHISESEVDVENIRVRLHDNGIEFL